LPDDGVTAGRWRRRGSAPRGKFKKVVAKLERDKMRPQAQETKRGPRVAFETPADWCEERIEDYYDALAGLEGEPSDAE
jgi:hypothetical protein